MLVGRRGHVVVLGVGALALTLSGCLDGPGFFRQNSATKTDATLASASTPIGASAASVVTEGETVVATLRSDSSETQTIAAAASSPIAAARVAFAPGTLAIDTEITVEEGAPLVSAVLADELGISATNNISAAGSPVVISSSAVIDAQRPFVVSLGVTNGAVGLVRLNLTGVDLDRLVIAYKVYIAAESRTIIGLIPRSQITVTDGVASFEIQYFGVYQPALADKPIEERSAVTTSTPILTKKAAAAATQPVWSLTQVKYDLAKNEVSCTATLTGTVASRCLLEVDRDQAEPFDRLVAITTTAGVAQFLSTDSGQFACRIECIDDQGRATASPWSSDFTVAIPPTTPPTTTTTPPASPFHFVGFFPASSALVQQSPIPEIAAVFDRPLAASLATTLPASAFTLYDDTVKRFLPVTYNVHDDRIAIVPSGPLPMGANFVLQLNGDFLSADQQALNIPGVTSSFSTKPGDWAPLDALASGIDTNYAIRTAQAGDTVAIAYRMAQAGDTGLRVIIGRGNQWHQPFRVSERAGTDFDPYGADVALAVGPQGDVAVAYRRADALHIDTRYYRAATNTWSNLVTTTVSAPAYALAMGDVVVDEAGQATVFFKQAASSQAFVKYLTFAADGTTSAIMSTGEEMPYSSSGMQMKARANVNGDILLAYQNVSIRAVAAFFPMGAGHVLMAPVRSADTNALITDVLIDMADDGLQRNAMIAYSNSEGVKSQFVDVATNGQVQWSAAVLHRTYPSQAEGLAWRTGGNYDLVYTAASGDARGTLLIVSSTQLGQLSGTPQIVAIAVLSGKIKTARSQGGSLAEMGLFFARTDDIATLSIDRLAATFSFDGSWKTALDLPVGAMVANLQSTQVMPAALGLAMTGTGRATVAWVNGTGSGPFDLNTGRLMFDSTAAWVDGGISTQRSSTPDALAVYALQTDRSGKSMLLYGQGSSINSLNLGDMVQPAAIP